MEEYLRYALPFWKQLTSEQQELAVRSMLVRRCQRGEFIYNPLKKTEGLRLIRDGQVRISIAAAGGKGLTLERLGEGDICTLSIRGLMDLQELDLYAEVEQDSTILVIAGPEYRKLHEENQAVREFNYQMMVESLSRMVGMVSLAALATAQERLADLLLRHYKKTGAAVLFLTHEEMARDIGTAREVVSRILRQFQEKEIVRQGRGKVQILDSAALESVRNELKIQ